MTDQLVLSGVGGGGATAVSGVVSLHKITHSGDVLVTHMTDPGMLRDMIKASAVVTDEGGKMCHAAIVCMELGIPFVVGTRDATSKLTDGMQVTVSPMDGRVVANG